LTIGSISLNGILVAVALSAGIGMAAVLLWVRQAPNERQGPWMDLFTTAALVVILVWKFGIVWRQPSLIWQQPLMLLITSGDESEAAAGAVAAFVYLWVAARRRGLSLRRTLDALAPGAAAGLAAWNLLSAADYRWGYALLCLGVTAALLRRPAADGRREAGGYAVLFCYSVGAGALALSLFIAAPPGAPPGDYAGLAGRQWLFVMLALSGVLLDRRKENAG
ncbi:hypothetical protein, partial [Paenibacillus darwinianus]